VPHSAAGRLIGKGGKNVREIQRISGALIKLPVDLSRRQGSASGRGAVAAAAVEEEEEETLPEASGGVPAGETARSEDSDDIVVQVYGNFISTQASRR